MSKIFYDRYIILEEVELELDSLCLEHDERQELDSLVDDLIHHRLLDRILLALPREHHEEFISKFHQCPHDEMLLDYLNARIEQGIEEHIKDEVEKIKKEILEDVKGLKKK